MNVNQNDLNSFFKGDFSFKNKGFRFFYLIIGAIFAIWLISGIYIVGPGEEGVILRFGKYVASTKPGPHYHLPYPIETVSTPKIAEVRRIEVGFRMISPGPPARYRNMPKEAFMLTGDENIVGLAFIVQFKISNAKDYLFNVYDVKEALKDVAESSMRSVMGKHKIDDALTSGKFQIQEETKLMIQEVADLYKMGLVVLNVQLQDVHPPEEVVSAFKEVASAREDKSKYINEAQGYRNDVIPKARGEGEKMILDAQAYKEKRIKEAKGDASRFVQIYNEYRKAPSVTRKRLYIETMREVMPKFNKYIIESDKRGGLINLLQLQGKQGVEK